MINLFRKKKVEIEFDKVEMVKFYNMLLKMKKKRPNFDINSMMTRLYGADYEKHI